MIIELTNITKIIKKYKVIDDISVKFHSGKVIGLKGCNGSGKTMLMRIICGLILPTKGEISIDNKILGKDITFPESIGILLENPSFLNEYSGFRNLKILASIKDMINDEQIRKAIKQVGLDPDDKRSYRKYSLGMKQRLGIAAAIMEEPDIILLDEPSNSLDDSGVELLKDIVLQEKKRGALIIISCHDFHIIKELSDEIHVIENGKLVDFMPLES